MSRFLFVCPLLRATLLTAPSRPLIGRENRKAADLLKSAAWK